MSVSTDCGTAGVGRGSGPICGGAEEASPEERKVQTLFFSFDITVITFLVFSKSLVCDGVEITDKSRILVSGLRWVEKCRRELCVLFDPSPWPRGPGSAAVTRSPSASSSAQSKCISQQGPRSSPEPPRTQTHRGPTSAHASAVSKARLRDVVLERGSPGGARHFTSHGRRATQAHLGLRR